MRRPWRDRWRNDWRVRLVDAKDCLLDRPVLHRMKVVSTDWLPFPPETPGRIFVRTPRKKGTRHGPH